MITSYRAASKVTPIWIAVVVLCVGTQPFLLGFYGDDWPDSATAARIAPAFSAALFRYISFINPSRIGYMPLRYLFSSLFRDRTPLWQGATLAGNCLVALALIRLIDVLAFGGRNSTRSALGRSVAVWIGLCWLLLPWNDALLFWPTMLPNVVTLAGLGLLCLWLIEGWSRHNHHALTAGLLYLWMCLGYEAFYFQWITVALIGLALWREGRARIKDVASSVAGLFAGQACAALWLLISPRVMRTRLHGPEHSIPSAWPRILFGDLLTTIPSIYRSFGALKLPFAAVALALAAIWCVLLRRSPRAGDFSAPARATFMLTLVSLIGGTLSILAFALGGRGIQATGGATRTFQVFNFWLVVAVGIAVIGMLERCRDSMRAAVLALSACLGGLLAAGHISRLSDWATAWRLQQQILTEAPLEQLQKTPLNATVLMINRPGVHGAPIFNSVWDLNAAMPWKYPSLIGRVFFAYNPDSGVLRWEGGMLRYETGEPYETPTPRLYVWRPAERSFAEASEPLRVLPNLAIETDLSKLKCSKPRLLVSSGKTANCAKCFGYTRRLETSRCQQSWPARNGDVKNFHLPLPEDTYSQLKAEAARAKVPATILAREAIDAWLRQQLRKARHNAIADYAAEVAGTSFDLDSDLESAGIEHLVKSGAKRK